MKRAKSESFINGYGDEINQQQQQQQPYLSGAYIRTFVQKLASSRSMGRQSHDVERKSSAVADQEDPSMAANSKPKKKQVRRRLQARKPYQEKMLNMAEARREIVTALKLHRAAMKEQLIPTEQKSRRNPRFIYASTTTQNDVVSPPPLSLDLALPSQALGLNLNLHNFLASPTSIYSPSTSSSPPLLPPPENREGFEFLGEEVMEIPPWLNANESCLHHVDDQDFLQASVLPCMDIEEIEGMDGDWFA